MTTTERRPSRFDDLRFVTTHYEALQGLSLVPGLVLLAGYFSFSAWAGQRLPGWAWVVGAAVLLPLTLGAGMLISRWYAARYGTLSRRPSAGTGSSLATVALLGLAGVGGLLPRGWYSPEAVLLALGILAGAVVVRELRPVLLPVGVLLLVAGVLPLGTWLGLPAHPLSHASILLAVFVVAWLVTALYAHAMLARVLGGRGRA